MNILSRVYSYQSRGRAVGMAIRLGTGWSGVRMPVEGFNFPTECPLFLLGCTQRPILYVWGGG